MDMLDPLMVSVRSGLQDGASRADWAAGAQERIMTNDDWVEDVRRWYYGGNPPAAEADLEPGAPASSELGYEAAHPSLQARNWPDAPLPRAERPAV